MVRNVFFFVVTTFMVWRRTIFHGNNQGEKWERKNAKIQAHERQTVPAQLFIAPGYSCMASSPPISLRSPGPHQAWHERRWWPPDGKRTSDTTIPPPPPLSYQAGICWMVLNPLRQKFVVPMNFLLLDEWQRGLSSSSYFNFSRTSKESSIHLSNELHPRRMSIAIRFSCNSKNVFSL